MKEERIQKVLCLAKQWTSLMKGKGDDNGYGNGYGVISPEVEETRKILSKKGVVEYWECPGCSYPNQQMKEELKKLLSVTEEEWKYIISEHKGDDCIFFSNLNIDGIFRQLVLKEDLEIKLHYLMNQKRINSLNEEIKGAEEKNEKLREEIRGLKEALERKRAALKENETLIAECFF